MPYESVANTLLTVVGGIAVAWLGLKGGKKLTENADTPKNRTDATFGGYDKLIVYLERENKYLKEENIKKDREIERLESQLYKKDLTNKQ